MSAIGLWLGKYAAGRFLQRVWPYLLALTIIIAVVTVDHFRMAGAYERGKADCQTATVVSERDEAIGQAAQNAILAAQINEDGQNKAKVLAKRALTNQERSELINNKILKELQNAPHTGCSVIDIPALSIAAERVREQARADAARGQGRQGPSDTGRDVLRPDPRAPSTK